MKYKTCNESREDSSVNSLECFSFTLVTLSLASWDDLLKKKEGSSPSAFRVNNRITCDAVGVEHDPMQN